MKIATIAAVALTCAAPALAGVAVTVTPAGYRGSTTDLFDVAQGTTITASSSYIAGQPANAIGATTGDAEHDTVVFADNSDAVQTLSFATAAPVTIGGFAILLAQDPASNGDIRGYRDIALFGSADGVNFTSLGAASLGTAPYEDTYGANGITVTATFAATTDQFFRFEGTPRLTTAQTPYTGGRIVEIDALPAASGTPEPASWALMLAGFGIVGGVLRQRATTVRVAA